MQGTQSWPSEQSGVPLDSDASDEHLIQVWAQDPIVVSSGQPTSPQDIHLPPYLTDPDAFSCVIEEQDIMALLDDDLLHHYLANINPPGIPDDVLSHLVFLPNGELGFPPSWHLTDWPPQLHVGPSETGQLSSQALTDTNPQGPFPFPFRGNGQSQVGNVICPLPTPPRAPGFPTSWPIIDSSPQSPVAPSAAGHLSSLDLDLNPQGLFPFPLGGYEQSQASNGQVLVIPSSGAADSPTSIDSSPQSPLGPSASAHLSSLDFPFSGNEHSQPGNGQFLPHLVIPPSRAAGPPTSSTTTSPSAQSPMGPSAAGPHVTAEDDIRTVGSPQIQQAAARRRKNDGIYQCTFPNCNSTFTKSHNLQYHKYAHKRLKPYKCSACGFATAYPTTLGEHVKRACKGKQQVIP